MNGCSDPTVMLSLLDEYREMPSEPILVRLIMNPVITPFWFSGAGGFQEMVTEVELTGVASTSRGGPVGAEEGNREQSSRE